MPFTMGSAIPDTTCHIIKIIVILKFTQLDYWPTKDSANEI